MAATNTTLTAGQRAAHAIALSASTVDTVTFTGYVKRVRVVNLTGDAIIYFTLDGSTPTVGGVATYVLPAAISNDEEPVPDSKASNAVVKLISAGTPTYSVLAVDPS